MRIYNPNPKHEQAGVGGRKGTRLDLSVAEATQLLNDPVNCIEVPAKRQFVAVRNGKIYVFQDDNVGGYHGYPVTGQEITTNFSSVASRVATLMGTNHKRLSRMDTL